MKNPKEALKKPTWTFGTPDKTPYINPKETLNETLKNT